jgi:hypothetical protein
VGVATTITPLRSAAQGSPMDRFERYVTAFASAALALGVSLGASAGTFFIDQSNTQANFGRNFEHLGPMGQEFTPMLHALDVVELFVWDASCSVVGSQGGSMAVRIREGSITGPILATSATFSFPNCFSAVASLAFPSVVPLTPGDLYVIEPFYVSGNSAGVDGYDGPSVYAGGRGIIQGVPVEDNDLWFREGLAYFVAETKAECQRGGWENLVRFDGTPFDNQGTCIKYVKTGK